MDPTRLRVIELEITHPLVNIAVEELLHYSVEYCSQPAVRFWRSGKAVVLGASRPVSTDVNLENCRADNVPVLRRHTGGGTVYLHPDVLNFTVTVPYNYPDIQRYSHIRESTHFILNPLLEALKQCGIEADINNRGDITVRGRKIGGNAQARKKRSLLHHGTLMFDARVGEMERYLKVPPERRDIPHTDFVAGLLTEGSKIDEGLIRDVSIAGWAKALDCCDVFNTCIYPAESLLLDELIIYKYALTQYIYKR